MLIVMDAAASAEDVKRVVEAYITNLVKHSIEKEYNDEIDDVRKEIADILALPDVVLDANFEENHAKLLKKDEQDWQKNFGDVCLRYFRCISFRLDGDLMLC